MSETLLEDLEQFFAGLPATVRDDLSFMMVVLSDENQVVYDVGEVYARSARGLFDARTRIGRIANLINAVSVFDVYFAMDANRRFGPRGPGRRVLHDGGAAVVPDHYAAWLEAIQAAARQWQELRRNTFTPAAIAAALVPPDSSGVRRLRSTPTTFKNRSIEASHDSVS